MATVDERQAFAVLMAVLGTAFGDNGMPKARADIYFEHLRDIPIPTLKEAVDSIVRSRKFSSIPTIAEIREAALGRDDEIETAALGAWGRAVRAVERGLYLSDDFDINEAVRVAFGGWEAFGNTDPENGVADRAHFIRVFRGLARQRRDAGWPAIGAKEQHRALPRGQEVVDGLVRKLGSGR